MNADNPSTLYQTDPAQYLQKIIALFGAYKKRSFAFLNLAPGLSILEAGCGAGDDALALAALAGPSGRIVGIDANPDLIAVATRIAKTANLPVEFMAGDLSALPFPDHSFDRVRSDRVFQHLKAPEKALSEMIRVAKPGGWISVLDVDWNTLVIDSSLPAVTHSIVAFLNRQHINSSAGRQLYGMLKQAGLTEVEAYAETVCITEWPVAAMVYGIDSFAKGAVAAGIISEGNLKQWLSDVVERDRQGRFFSAITGFVVRGRK